MNELEQLKAKKVELESELNKVKDKIYQIEADEFCTKWGLQVGDVVEFTDSFGARKGKIEGVVYGVYFEVRLFKGNGELGKRATNIWPACCQIKKLEQ